MTRAMSISVGAPQVAGAGADAVLDVPVTLTPTGRSDDVSFGGFGSTFLFRQAAGSPTDVDVPLRTDAPIDMVMSVVPALDEVGQVGVGKIDPPLLAQPLGDRDVALGDPVAFSELLGVRKTCLASLQHCHSARRMSHSSSMSAR